MPTSFKYEVDAAELGVGEAKSGIRGFFSRIFGGAKSNEEIDLVIRDWMHKIAYEGELALQKHVPVDSGKLLESVSSSRVNKLAGGNIYTVEISVDTPYAGFVDEGTGDRTGSKEKDNEIRATHGNVMAFEKSSGETVFTHLIHGQKPSHFMDEAQADMDVYIEATKEEVAAKISALLS